MWVQEIWRYPVKSMAGEMMAEADVDENGVVGDRILYVQNGKGKTFTARTRPELLRHHAVLNPDGAVLVDGRPWQDQTVAQDVEAAAGPGTHLTPSDPTHRFDVLPLLVTTDGMLEEVGYDRRRFRPNLVIGGVEGMGERDWELGELRIRDLVIGVKNLRARCIMTTYDPDTGKQDLNVLRKVQREYEGVLGLNSLVMHPGHIAVGDPIEFVPRA